MAQEEKAGSDESGRRGGMGGNGIEIIRSLGKWHIGYQWAKGDWSNGVTPWRLQ